MARAAALAVGLVLLAAPGIARAHDIPRDVTIQVLVRPEGRTLHLLLRAPLKGITDVEYPRRGRDMVDLAGVEPALRDAARVYLADRITILEETRSLPAPRITAVRFSLESNRAFASYDEAVRHLAAPPLSPDTAIFWEQGMLDVALEYPIASETSRFAIDARFERLGLRVVTALRFLPPGGAVRVFELAGDEGLVRLDPRWHQAAGRFVALGFAHILEGTDHLLFLLCLVLPFRRLRPLIVLVTAFTVAHSITLLASAYRVVPGALWFPPLVELLIAVSIVYMALENIVAPALGRRWWITFVFGLIHGFGFSFGLEHTLQFAGTHLLSSLLAFNVGVELGQLVVLAAAVPLLDVAFRRVVAERTGLILVSAFVAHTAWHWTSDRWATLAQFSWPPLTAAGLAEAARWAMAFVALTGLAWLVQLMVARRFGETSGDGGGGFSAAPTAGGASPSRAPR